VYAALEDGVDDGRDVVVVEARTEEGDLGPLVLRGERFEVGGQLLLDERRRELELAVEPHARGEIGE
jgi:hypothetical protein